tara:strand:+ start:79 stop:564 length:486 start_codon:yes stop_codon:yes gene_type:complete
MFKKIKELKNVYQQGVLDSLADNSYLMIVVLLSLINDVHIKDKKQLLKIYDDIIAILYESNFEYKKLKILRSDIEEIHKTYNTLLLDQVLLAYKDVYEPGGESYAVLKNEYKLNLSQIDNLKFQYQSLISSNLEKLFLSNQEHITNQFFQNHLKKIISKLH